MERVELIPAPATGIGEADEARALDTYFLTSAVWVPIDPTVLYDPRYRFQPEDLHALAVRCYDGGRAGGSGIAAGARDEGKYSAVEREQPEEEDDPDFEAGRWSHHLRAIEELLKEDEDEAAAASDEDLLAPALRCYGGRGGGTAAGAGDEGEYDVVDREQQQEEDEPDFEPKQWSHIIRGVDDVLKDEDDDKAAAVSEEELLEPALRCCGGGTAVGAWRDEGKYAAVDRERQQVENGRDFTAEQRSHIIHLFEELFKDEDDYKAAAVSEKEEQTADGHAVIGNGSSVQATAVTKPEKEEEDSDSGASFCYLGEPEVRFRRRPKTRRFVKMSKKTKGRR